MTELARTLRSIIETERERFGVPGCAVAVVKDGAVLLCEGFGQRNTAADLPVTAETLFAIGSSTKTFTAAVLATLVDAGELDFDAPLRTYLPGFEMFDSVATSLLSVRDCLSHRSGLPRHDLLWYGSDGYLTREDVVAALKHLPPTKSFREVWQYNNLLYITAGYLAGRLTGGTYEEAVSSRILEPLGMSRTNFDVLVSQADADHARPYARTVGEKEALEVPFSSLGVAGPAGNINSSAAELVSWLLTLSGRGVDGKEPLLSAPVLQQLGTPAIPMQAAFPGAARVVGYGLAQMVEDYRGKRAVHHGGNIDGFSSQVYIVPEEGIGIAVLTNLNATFLRDVLPYAILDAIDGLPEAGHGVRYEELYTAMTTGAEQAKQAKAGRTKDLAAVRPLQDYLGTYTHAGYGDVVVTEAADGLSWRFKGLSGEFRHKHLEVFAAVLQHAGEEMNLDAQFTHDVEGEVSALLFGIEPALPPLRFDRQPDSSHITAELLESCVGTYALGPVTATVTRRGDIELMIAMAGGSARLLTPVRGRIFTVEGQTIEFVDGELRTDSAVFVRQE